MQNQLFQQARLSRDARFDGQFFVAVKTTGIFCRPICPAPAPKESNIEYFPTSVAAANQGYRPCLRCRPDAAPDSFAWKGKNTSFERALTLINEGALSLQSISQLSERLGISSRYLNKLFQDNLGTSAKNYAQHQQLMFAKTLLQQTPMTVTDIAFASGFKSLRRFNDCFQKKLKLTPSALRKKAAIRNDQNSISVFISYRPPYNWETMRDFLARRATDSIEWFDHNSYGRTFTWPSNNSDIIYGQFTAQHIPEKNGFQVNVTINNFNYLMPVIRNIRRILDVDTQINSIEEQLSLLPGINKYLTSGLRLPGTWNLFEAGVRAILGQQISVVGALKLVDTLVKNYGRKQNDLTLFPLPKDLLAGDLTELKMPAARRTTLLKFAQFSHEHPCATPDDWLSLKGIGPWTIDYAKMRGLSDPNIWLGGDLGIQKALNNNNVTLDPESAAPWKSYLTFQLWNLS
jgi:AraC family transcriptional regulator of adaptative response / DNA-3-methyladenine glycosylase II